MGIAVGLSGLAFGAAAVTAGLSVAQACVLSLLAFTGASQFALVGVIAGGGSLTAGAAGALLLGARNTSTACAWPTCSPGAARAASSPPTA